MKKFFLVFCLAFSLFSITGCGRDEKPKEDEKVEDVEEEDEIGDGEVDDE
jgi:predicted small lipoprotein YifL